LADAIDSSFFAALTRSAALAARLAHSSDVLGGFDSAWNSASDAGVISCA
jgi:hypothetical protein